jgi:hypothetical protein
MIEICPSFFFPCQSSLQKRLEKERVEMDKAKKQQQKQVCQRQRLLF